MKKIIYILICSFIIIKLNAQTPDTCFTKIQVINIAQKTSFLIKRVDVLQNIIDTQDDQLSLHKKLHLQDSISNSIMIKQNELLKLQVNEIYGISKKLEKKNKRSIYVITGLAGALLVAILIK